jgi:hypothetical protein
MYFVRRKPEPGYELKVRKKKREASKTNPRTLACDGIGHIFCVGKSGEVGRSQSKESLACQVEVENLPGRPVILNSGWTLEPCGEMLIMLISATTFIPTDPES